MIRILEKHHINYVFVPINRAKRDTNYTCRLVNTLSKFETVIDIEDEDTYEHYIVFPLNAENLEDGEYEYELKNSVFEVVGTGLIRISKEVDTVILKTQKTKHKINDTRESGTIKTLTL